LWLLPRGEEGGRRIRTHFSTLDADKKSKLSMPDVDEKQQATSPLAWRFDKKHFSTLDADEMSKFSTPDVDEKQQVTSPLAWRFEADEKSK
jgi:hypothetical protein